MRASGVDQLKPMRGAQLLVSRRRGSVTNGATIGFSSSTRLMIVHVGIDLVSQAQVQRQLRMHPPVVLDEPRQIHVVRVGDYQILIGFTAPQRDGEQQVVVVDAAVPVAIELREVFDELDPAVAKHAEIEVRVHPLELSADLPLMPAARERDSVSATCQRCLASCPAAL